MLATAASAIEDTKVCKRLLVHVVDDDSQIADPSVPIFMRLPQGVARSL